MIKFSNFVLVDKFKIDSMRQNFREDFNKRTDFDRRSRAASAATVLEEIIS